MNLQKHGVWMQWMTDTQQQHQQEDTTTAIIVGLAGTTTTWLKRGSQRDGELAVVTILITHSNNSNETNGRLGIETVVTRMAHTRRRPIGNPRHQTLMTRTTRETPALVGLKETLIHDAMNQNTTEIRIGIKTPEGLVKSRKWVGRTEGGNQTQVGSLVYERIEGRHGKMKINGIVPSPLQLNAHGSPLTVGSLHTKTSLLIIVGPPSEVTGITNTTKTRKTSISKIDETGQSTTAT
ncbi:hypothetical protein AAF712_001953 [Marasmius tenuissimus]|uniref:Uncharacterized protein n=1 Tax=Marasmius tenuissimus TaxID=585030 RepID=A0ABR3ABJ7_9AGAR